ncbi:MAG: hypothetical protein MR598_04385 [Erysipelotrichaceae bacterium]|nr:hypothetical protein [Erysipelotrichaceae bacterium]
MGKVINNQLQYLKQFITIDKYREVARQVDEITDYYTSQKEDFNSVISEGDDIATDLLYKVIDHNERTIELPINISYIKTFCVSSNIKKEQLYDYLLWIALRYLAVSRCIKWKESKEIYNNSKNLEN